MMYTYKESADIINFLNENCVGNLRSDVLDEAAQPKIAAGVLNKMLDLTISRYSKIDFSEIERSRGDVTNCRFYKNLRESLDILSDVDNMTHNLPSVAIISTALNNLLMLKEKFKYAFRMKNSFAVLLYNTIYYTIMEATSYVIATSIDFVKASDTSIEIETYETNGRDTILISNLEKFNKEVGSGNVEKFIKSSADYEEERRHETMNEAIFDGAIITGFEKFISNPRNLKIVGIGTAILALVYVAINIIPIIKMCIYVIFKLRHSISDAAKMQAEMLELNTSAIKANGADEKVINKQEAAAKRFRKIANTFALEHDKAQNDAKRDDREDPIDTNTILI